MKVRANISLALAIDYTSSMTDDIDAVKENVIKLLTDTVGSTNEPADYVLSLFHDPGKMLFDEFCSLNLVQGYFRTAYVWHILFLVSTCFFSLRTYFFNQLRAVFL